MPVNTYNTSIHKIVNTCLFIRYVIKLLFFYKLFIIYFLRNIDSLIDFLPFAGAAAVVAD